MLGGDRASAVGPNASNRAVGDKRPEQQDRAATEVVEMGDGRGDRGDGKRLRVEAAVVSGIDGRATTLKRLRARELQRRWRVASGDQ
ncbi:hypothetical protein BHM03_00006752 [Ensete ventricosum]|uniref:Uncharacterized protein n=1 Tax=Ensete ventricosum TaxID=4639 RepID=A0A445MBX3_ENSVE|nr:hypothetical protein BHM03_00006752 [Ensete ventricosum]